MQLIKNIKNNTKQYNSKEAMFDSVSYVDFLKGESNNQLQEINKNLNKLKKNEVKTVKIGKLSLPIPSAYYKKTETNEIQKSLQSYKNNSLAAKFKKENPILFSPLISPFISPSMKVGYSSLAALGISPANNKNSSVLELD
jgi:hypothetical protein